MSQCDNFYIIWVKTAVEEGSKAQAKTQAVDKG